MRLYLVPNKQMLPKEWSEAYENISCGELSLISSGSVTPKEVFTGANILQSFYYCDSFTEEIIIPNCKRFLLDSGAFSFFSKGKAADWGEYIKKYAGFINRNRIDQFFELDIDVLVGYEKVLYYRAKLEDMTGKASIPVWHRERGREEFLKMCEDYDYIALGGIAAKNVKATEYKYFPWFIDEAHKRGAKIHGLGYTNLKGLQQYHFDSVDSSTWSAGNRFGHIFTFTGKTLVQRKRNPGERIADHQKVSLHNFTEWKKFADYAETHL